MFSCLAPMSSAMVAPIHRGLIKQHALTCGETAGRRRTLEPRDNSVPNFVNPGHRTRAQSKNTTKSKGNTAYLVDGGHFAAASGFCDVIGVAIWTLD